MGDLTHVGWESTTLAMRSLFGAASDPGSFAASQREVLHPRRQRRVASGPQGLELLVPAVEVPDFEMGALADEHDGARDVREVAQLGRDEQAARGIGLDLLGETDQQALPQRGLPVEAW